MTKSPIGSKICPGLEVYVSEDLARDMILIKLRVSRGYGSKQGVIIRIPSETLESLPEIPPGGEYPSVGLEPNL